MILKTQDVHPSPNPPVQSPFDLAAELADRYEISALSGLMATTRAAMDQEETSVAVFGRFKAGKSSFLNDFIGQDVLPIGVIPVTAVVTEILYGPRELARVHYRNGSDGEVPLDQLSAYISEKETPGTPSRLSSSLSNCPRSADFAASSSWIPPAWRASMPITAEHPWIGYRMPGSLWWRSVSILRSPSGTSTC